MESERLLITGDAVGVCYSGFDFPIPATPPPGFDGEQYVKSLKGFMRMEPAALLLPHFGLVRQHIRAFLETNIETIRRWTSIAAETVKAEEPVERLFETFMADVVNRSGLARPEIPDHIARSIKLSAMGCYTYAQEKTVKQ